MNTRIVPLFAMTVLMAAVASFSCGCAWSIGGTKSDSASSPTQPTRGQELIDLKKAHDQGAISEEEYQQLRQCVMDK